VWSIGFNRRGLGPERGPYTPSTFPATRDLLLVNILDVAASCARQSGAKDEAPALKTAQSRIIRVQPHELGEVRLTIGGYDLSCRAYPT
jgi:hypothetical protein